MNNSNRDDMGKWKGVKTGSLSDLPGMRLLNEAAKSRFTGAVRLERDDETVTIYFEKGTPTGVDSNAPRHEYATMLLDADKIDKRTADAYRAAMDRGSDNPISGLRQAGIEDKKTLALLIVWRGGTILGEICEWERGTYSQNPGTSVPPKIARCRMRALHKPKVNWRDINLDEKQMEYLKRNLSRYVLPSPFAAQVVSSLGLSDKEARYVEHVLGKPMQLKEAMTISTLFRSLTRKVLFQLLDRGALELHETNPDGSTPIPLEELEPYCRLLEQDNDFNVLSIHATSTQKEIEERYKDRLSQFEAARYSGARPEHLQTLEQIRQRLERAWEIMKDPGKRREYRNTIYGDQQLATFFDLQLQKADFSFRMRKNYNDAMMHADSALELNPQSGEARLILAGALTGLGRTLDARKQLAQIKFVQKHLSAELQELRLRLG